MSSIIKYNDFIQINPDNRVLKLDKSEKIQILDSMLSSAYSGGKGLIITYDLSHSGRKINNRIYSTKGQQRGIDSLIQPYAKPILKNHDQGSEPIGRFIGGEWQNLYDEAKSFLQSSEAALDIHNAFAGDDPGKIYHTLKSFDLINNKQWPGLGRMRVQANITDEEAIKKFMDGRYLTFSAGSTTDRHVCSICESDWAKDGMCEHRHGKVYDKETCVFITGDFIVLEGSVVNTPADDLSQIVQMEMKDSEEPFKAVEYLNSREEIIMTDSIYDLGVKNETQRLQATEQIDAYQKEEKKEEEVKKKYDHEMTISETAMMELHSKGETYITQRGDNESMVIKIKYSGKMSVDGFAEEYLGFEELVNELLDEKTFKVPSGAKGNAQKVLDWKKEHGSEVKGMTPVGWARARQLASKSEIGLSTVKRMSAFNRHRKNAEVAPEFKTTPWKDRGYVAWLGWGGNSGIDWAIKISAANDSESGMDMIGDFDKDAYKSSPKGKGAKTPAKPSERIKGSKKNKEGSASKANSSISVGSVLSSLKEKISSHNKKYGKEKGKRVSLGMLKAVYRRGAGAFSATHRPGMSRSGWGVARVNAFLKLVRSGRPSNPKYVQDNDLLPAGHPRKSSNKSKSNKDFKMDKQFIENEVVEEINEDKEAEILVEEADLMESVEEPTKEEQVEHDESFEEDTLDADALDADNSSSDEIVIEWELLDLALQGITSGTDAELTSEARSRLPESVFCGPDRSFPIPDCAHVTAAKRLVGRYKGSEGAKAKIMQCVESKASSMNCNKSKDYLELEARYKEVLDRCELLEEKLNLVVDKLVEKNESSIEKVENFVENDSEEQVLLNSVKVSNPSEHISEDDTEQKMSKKPVSNLGSFEQKVVDSYNDIAKQQGEIAAENYLASKSTYLPRGFHPKHV